MEELLQYIMHEIAFDGDWGCNIDRLKLFIRDYYRTQTSFVQTLDEDFYTFIWQLLHQQSSVRIGLIQEASLEVYIAPQKSKKPVASGQSVTEGDLVHGGGLKLIDNANTLSLSELLQAFGDTLHVAVDAETCFRALTGSHIRQSRLTPMVYTALQLISRSREEGLSVIELGKKSGYDQKTCFYLVKQLLSMDLIVKLSRGGPGGGNFCIHKSFYIRSPFWQGIRNEANKLEEEAHRENAFNPAQPSGRLFDEIDTRHLASPELIKSRIIKLLKNSENGLHYYHNLLVAIGFNAPTRPDRRFFIIRIRELIKEKVIEKVLVPRKERPGSKALCIRLVEDPRTTLLDGVVVQNDDVGDDEQGDSSEKMEPRMPHLYMTIQRQMVQLLEEAGAEGLTLNDISTRLGMFDRRTLDLLLHRLENPSPSHLADLQICVFIENLGRERRNRYFTLVGYKAFVQNENIDVAEPPTPSSSVDKPQYGGFQLVDAEMFYDGERALAKIEDDYRDRTNPPRTGTRKIGRPRKLPVQKPPESTGGDSPVAQAKHGKKRRRTDDSEATELPPPNTQKRTKKARFSTSEGPAQDVTAEFIDPQLADTDNSNLPGLIQSKASSNAGAMEIDSTINQVPDEVPISPTLLTMQQTIYSPDTELLNTLQTTANGGGGMRRSGEFSTQRPKSGGAKKNSINLSQLRAENEIMRVVSEAGGVANIASKEFFEMYTRVLVSLESSGEPISMPVGSQLDRRTLRKILDRLIERGRLRTLTLTVTPRTIQPRLAKLVYTPDTSQEKLDNFISSLQEDPMPNAVVVHKELEDAIDFSRPLRMTSQDQPLKAKQPRPFDKQGKATKQRNEIDFAGDDDEIRARFLADHRTTAQLFGFILGKARRARELHQFTLQALQHIPDSPNIVSSGDRVIALSYYFQDIPISTYCSIVSISEYNQQLFDFMKTSSGRETRVGDLPSSLYESLKIGKARARSRLFDLMEILGSLGLLTPLKPSDSDIPALVCSPSGPHPSSYDVASMLSHNSSLNRMASYWQVNEFAPIYYYSHSIWPPPFRQDLSVRTADESMAYWHELENACLEKGEIIASTSAESTTGPCKCMSSVVQILRRRQSWTSVYTLSWEQKEYLQRKWTDPSTGYTPLSDDDGGRRLLIRISNVVSAPFDTVYNFFLTRHQTFQKEARRIRERKQHRDTALTGGRDIQEKALLAKTIAISKEGLASDWEHLVQEVHPGLSSRELARLKELRVKYIQSRGIMTQGEWKSHIYEALKTLGLQDKPPLMTRSKPARRPQFNATGALQGGPSVSELQQQLKDAIPSSIQERTAIATEKNFGKQTRSPRFHWTAEYDDLARDASAILRTRCRSWHRMDWTALDQLFPSLPRNNVRQRIAALRQVPGGESYFRRLEDRWCEIWMDHRGTELLPDPNPDHPSDFDLAAHIEFLRQNVDKKLLTFGNVDSNHLAEPDYVLGDDVTDFLSRWDVTEYPSAGYNVDVLWSSIAEEQREKILLGRAFVVEQSYPHSPVVRADDVSVAESALKMVFSTAEDDYDLILASSFLENVGERNIKLATENLIARGIISEIPKSNRKTPGRSLRITDLNRDASGGFYRPEFYKQALAFDDVLEEDVNDTKEWDLLAQSGEMAGLVSSVSRSEVQFAIDISESVLHRKELDWNSKKVDDNQIETTIGVFCHSPYPNLDQGSVTSSPNSPMIVDSEYKAHALNEGSACRSTSVGVINCSGCVESELNRLMQTATSHKHLYPEILKNVDATGFSGLNYQDTLTWNDEHLQFLHIMTSANLPLCYWTGYDQPVLVSAQYIRPWTVLLPGSPTTYIFPRRWINFKGDKSLPLWRSALCAVASVLFLRPGLSLAELRRRLVSVYDRQELNDLLEFLLGNHFIAKSLPERMRNRQIREIGGSAEEDVHLSLTYMERCRIINGNSTVMTVLHGIKMLGVVGSGQMGLGIAYVSALRARVSVALTDKSEAQITSGLAFFDKLLKRDIEKGRITTHEAEEAKSRVQAVKDVKDLRDADMVIEAVSEDLSLKSTIFRCLAAEVRPDAILASNTSSIPITKIATSVVPEGISVSSPEGINHTSRVVGLHFFNPVPVMKLVELIPAIQTSKETLERARAFAIACGKEVTKSEDVPGFVSNALLMPFINEAIIHLEKGVATRDDIDKTLKLGMNHPMGPLQLADFIGLDTCLFIQRTLYEGTSDSKYRPSILLERMVDAGWLGKKSGKGFYDYN